jgi:hypothetical protein
MSLPTLLFLGPAVLCALSWLGVGRLIPTRLLTGDPLLDLLTRIALGASALATALFVLGRVGAFRPTVLVALTAALAIPGLWTLRPFLARIPRPERPGRLVQVLAALTVFALVLDLLGATAPPTSADALGYHLALPQHWLRIGHIDDPFWNYATFYPLEIEMLFGQGLALAGASAASAIHGILALLAAFAAYGLGRELGGGRSSAGLLGAGLLVLQGTFTWDATSTFVDMGLTLFVVLAVWHTVRYAKEPGRQSSLLAGALCGAAIGAKYAGPVAAIFVLAPLGVVAVRSHRAWDAALACVAAVALGACFYIRDWIVTGNPVYPLLFGGKKFTPFFQGYLDGSQKYSYPGTHGGNPLRIFILPLDLLLHGDRFDRGQYASTAIFVLGALALWVLRKNRLVLGLGAALAGYTLVWWYAIPQIRYLMPALAVLAAVAGAAFGPTLERSGRRRAALLVVLLLAVAAWAAPSFALERQLLPVTVGAESRAHHIQRLVGTYTAMQAVRQKVGPHALVGMIGYRWPFWYPGPSIWMGWPEFSPDVPASELVARLRHARVDFVLAWSKPPELVKLERCLRRIGSYDARYVTSRSRGMSEPIRLDLYSARGCYLR